MPSRYENSALLVNKSEIYEKLLKERNVKKINQYGTQTLFYPTREERAQLNIAQHIWSSTDKFWRLSEKYYGDPQYWWVIAFYNEKPTELDVSSGDIILIPQPLDQVLFYIKG
jgi:hypothetical protein